MICSSGSSVTMRNTFAPTLYTSSFATNGRPWLTPRSDDAAPRAIDCSRTPVSTSGKAASSRSRRSALRRAWHHRRVRLDLSADDPAAEAGHLVELGSVAVQEYAG